jgi:hypothetical protein
VSGFGVRDLQVALSTGRFAWPGFRDILAARAAHPPTPSPRTWRFSGRGLATERGRLVSDAVGAVGRGQSGLQPFQSLAKTSISLFTAAISRAFGSLSWARIIMVARTHTGFSVE